MSRHTPGPWRIGNHRGFNADHIQAVRDPDEEKSICNVYGIYLHSTVGDVANEPRCAEGLANARLIAAAPDLLAALKQVRGKIDKEIRRGGGIFADAELRYIDAAIAKAEGGAQ